MTEDKDTLIAQLKSQVHCLEQMCSNYAKRLEKYNKVIKTAREILQDKNKVQQFKTGWYHYKVGVAPLMEFQKALAELDKKEENIKCPYCNSDRAKCGCEV
jgi:hypothetical protein